MKVTLDIPNGIYALHGRYGVKKLDGTDAKGLMLMRPRDGDEYVMSKMDDGDYIIELVARKCGKHER